MKCQTSALPERCTKNSRAGTVPRSGHGLHSPRLLFRVLEALSTSSSCPDVSATSSSAPQPQHFVPAGTRVPPISASPASSTFEHGIFFNYWDITQLENAHMLTVQLDSSSETEEPSVARASTWIESHKPNHRRLPQATCDHHPFPKGELEF
jgi:hypothetical protein